MNPESRSCKLGEVSTKNSKKGVSNVCLCQNPSRQPVTVQHGRWRLILTLPKVQWSLQQVGDASNVESLSKNTEGNGQGQPKKFTSYHVTLDTILPWVQERR